MINKIANACLAFGAIGAIALLTVVVFMKAVDVPTVLVDVNTKKCVEVMMADGTEGSCNNMPEKYERQWVIKPVEGYVR